MTPTEKSDDKRLRIVKNPAADSGPEEEAVGAERPAGDVCPRCFGTGMEVVPGGGARRCECQTSNSFDRLFKNARIPARYQHCTINNYDVGAGDSEASASRWKAKGEASIVADD